MCTGLSLTEIFFGTYRSKKSNYRKDLCKYQLFQCDCKMIKLNFFQRKWRELTQLCGSFNTIQDSDYEDQKTIINNFQDSLSDLQKLGNKIICNACKNKYELQKQGNEIYIYKHLCSNNSMNIKPCYHCYIMQKQKYYISCQKCQFKILFMRQLYSEVIECPQCSLKFCCFCKSVSTLLSNGCKCRFHGIEKKINYLQIIIYINIFIIIIGLILIHFLEQSEYFQNIKCTIRDLFQNPLCTTEQMSIDLPIILIVCFSAFFIITLGTISGSLLSYSIQQKQKIQKIKTESRRSIRLGNRKNQRFLVQTIRIH